MTCPCLTGDCQDSLIGEHRSIPGGLTMRAAHLRTRAHPYPPPTDPIPTGPSRTLPLGPGRTQPRLTDCHNPFVRTTRSRPVAPTVGACAPLRHMTTTNVQLAPTGAARQYQPLQPSCGTPPARPRRSATPRTEPLPRHRTLPQPYSFPERTRRRPHRNPVRHAHHRSTHSTTPGTVTAHASGRAS